MFKCLPSFMKERIELELLKFTAMKNNYIVNKG